MNTDQAGPVPGPVLEYCRATTVEEVSGWFADRIESQNQTYAREKRLSGRCYVCQQDTRFTIAGMDNSANWRETLVCPRCGLINRWRGCFHFFEHLAAPEANSAIYLTEALSPLYALVRARYPNSVGSEFRTGLESGAHFFHGLRRIRMEDVTSLSFADESFNALLSFDVLEHVADYALALREFCRVLKPGGTALMSFPFTFGPETEIRATVNADGTIIHHLNPEYHADPLSRHGALCFQVFGMDILDELRRAGFADAHVFCYSSDAWGYLGANILVVGEK